MSLLSKHSPKRTRNLSNGPRSESKLQEVRSDPVVKMSDPELKTTETDLSQRQMIKQYKFKQEPFAQKEQLLQQSKSKNDKQVFGLYELKSKCFENLLRYLHGPIEPRVQSLIHQEKEYITSRLQLISDSKKEIQYKGFQDTLYYIKGEVVILEEQFSMSGFLREHFNIQRVFVLQSDKSIELRHCGYCNFWFDDRLEQVSQLMNTSSNKIQSTDSCARCCFNTACDFTRSTKV